jgi:phosphopantothenoylcysteine synthetase/decarboxylase
VSTPEVGFDAGENEVVIISAGGERHVARASKQRIAAEILDDVEQLLGRNGGAAD